MTSFLPTIILRHKKENLKKCSLSGLENLPYLDFYTYPKHFDFDLSNYVTLHFEGPLLSKKDKDLGLFLIDGTWKYAETMFKQVSLKQTLVPRSLPKELKTAYPRKQTGCEDPERGLASVEALYVAHKFLERPYDNLLEGYHFAKEFLTLNREILENL